MRLRKTRAMSLRDAGRALLLAALSLLLAGCAVFGEREGRIEARTPVDLERWELQAALLASGVHSARARLHWQQEPASFDITFAGPFGIAATRLRGDLEQVEIERGKRFWTSRDPARDLAMYTGVPVNLGDLQTWVLGLPRPGLRSVPPRHWESGPWIVEVLEQQVVGDYLLPRSLELRSELQTLLLRDMRWQLPGAADAG